MHDTQESAQRLGRYGQDRDPFCERYPGVNRLLVHLLQVFENRLQPGHQPAQNREQFFAQLLRKNDHALFRLFPLVTLFVDALRLLAIGVIGSAGGLGHFA